MVAVILHNVFSGFLKLALLAGSALYTGLVLMSYRNDGSRARPAVNWRDPVHSAEHLGVWLGVEALTFLIRMATGVFAMLSEASADVGEWFLRDHHFESR